jgi:hypothetical protein
VTSATSDPKKNSTTSTASLVRRSGGAVLGPPRPQHELQRDDGEEDDSQVEAVADLPRVVPAADVDPQHDVDGREEERQPARPVVVPVPVLAVLGAHVRPQEEGQDLQDAEEEDEDAEAWILLYSATPATTPARPMMNPTNWRLTWR